MPQSGTLAGHGRARITDDASTQATPVPDRLIGYVFNVGGPQANASFMPDGATAFVTLTSQNEVAAIDMAQLAVVARIPAGGEPMGLVMLNPATP